MLARLLLGSLTLPGGPWRSLRAPWRFLGAPWRSLALSGHSLALPGARWRRMALPTRFVAPLLRSLALPAAAWRCLALLAVPAAAWRSGAPSGAHWRSLAFLVLLSAPKRFRVRVGAIPTPSRSLSWNALLPTAQGQSAAVRLLLIPKIQCLCWAVGPVTLNPKRG